MAKNAKKNENKKTVAEIVTQRFIDALALGNVPWFKPWEMWSSWSRATGNDYRGANALMLSGGEYVTFKQAKEQGIKINKGAKSEMLVKYTEYMKKIPADKLEEHKQEIAYWERCGRVEHLEDGGVKIPAKSIKYYNVFNVEEFTDAEVKHEHKQPAHEWQPVEKAEAIAKAYREAHNITIEHFGNRAYNRDDAFTDGGHVQLPKREQFERVEEYYSTLFHELVHSTADYVNRDKSQYHRSDKARAREELVAEIGAAYILSFLGMETGYSIANSQAYVGNWAKNLKSDPNAILWAAPRAIEAAELILSAAPEAPAKEEPETKPAAVKYTKEDANIVKAVWKASENKQPLLASNFKTEAGNMVCDGYRAYITPGVIVERLTAKPLTEEERKTAENLKEQLCKVVTQSFSDPECGYKEITIELEEIKAHCKENKYTRRSKNVKPYILEAEGVKVGVNPVYLKDTLQLLGTNKVKLPKSQVKPLLFEGTKGKGIVLPIRIPA